MSNDFKFKEDDKFNTLFDLKSPTKILSNNFKNEKVKNFHENILLTTNDFLTGDQLNDNLKDSIYVVLNALANDSNDKNSYVIFQKFDEKNEDQNTAYFDKSFRNTTHIDMFFNTVPNVVLGQLIPYLKIRFLYPVEANIFSDKTIKNDLNTLPSTQNYIFNDNGDVEKLKNDKNLQNYNELFVVDFADNNQVTKLIGNSFYDRQVYPKSGKYFLTDESLYTSPSHLSSNFRPLLSISRMSVKIMPTIDFNVSFDEFNLSLTIHDKTKLYKFPHLIGVEYRNQISVIIEYGWSYPGSGNTEDDIYSYFFNNVLKRKVYCKMVNSSYSFDDVGQVKVEMKLMTKGADQLFILDCLENANSNSKSVRNQLKKLQDQLKEFLKIYKFPVGVRNSVLLTSLTNQSIETITNEQSKSLDELIKQLKTAKNANTNGDFIIDSEQKKIITNLVNNFQDILLPSKNSKNKDINQLKQEYDTFVSNLINNDFKSWVKIYRASQNKSIKDYYNNLSYPDDIKLSIKNIEKVFLHEILTFFIAKPLNKNENIKETQFIYYNFGKDAPDLISRRNIGEFFIDLDHLTETLKRNTNKRFTLEQFIGFILNEFLRKIQSPGYGLTSQYKGLFSKDKNTVSKTENTNKEAIEKAEKLRVESGKSVMIPPRVSFRVENANDILRIHIYDSTNRIIFKANNQEIEQLDNVKNLFKEWKSKNTEDLKSNINSSVDYFNLKHERKFSYLKETFKNHYPVLTFDGVGSNVIKSIQISNSADPATTTHLINQNVFGTVDTTTEKNYYTKVVPGKITMESLGFPLAEMHQTFFMDMNTGTDIDNLYHVTSISHTLEPGTFKTSYELMNADSFGAHENLFTEAERIKKIVNGNIQEMKPQPQSPTKQNGAKKSDKKTASIPQDRIVTDANGNVVIKK